MKTCLIIAALTGGALSSFVNRLAYLERRPEFSEKREFSEAAVVDDVIPPSSPPEHHRRRHHRHHHDDHEPMIGPMIGPEEMKPHEVRPQNGYFDHPHEPVANPADWGNDHENWLDALRQEFAGLSKHFQWHGNKQAPTHDQVDAFIKELIHTGVLPPDFSLDIVPASLKDKLIKWARDGIPPQVHLHHDAHPYQHHSHHPIFDPHRDSHHHHEPHPHHLYPEEFNPEHFDHEHFDHEHFDHNHFDPHHHPDFLAADNMIPPNYDVAPPPFAVADADHPHHRHKRHHRHYHHTTTTIELDDHQAVYNGVQYMHTH